MFIRDIAYATPSTTISSEIIAEQTGLEKNFIENKIGVKSRAFLSEDEAPLHLATQACQNLMKKNPSFKSDDIEAIVYVTQNPDYKIPHSSALIQSALNCSNDIACFDINLGCSGYVYALSIVKGLMLSEALNNVLLITCDPYSKVMGQHDKNTLALFGDAASVSWLSNEQGIKIHKTVFGTDGANFEHLIVRKGGATHPISSYFCKNTPGDDPAEFRLDMNGRGIFNFMMSRVPTSLQQCLEKNNVSKDQIDYYFFHQGSKFMLDQLVRKQGFNPEHVPMNIEEIGNTVSSSIPILMEQHRTKHDMSGKKAIACGFGVGLSWATTLLEF